ncbi:tRNA 2-selenouridine(34) synthase MnmH [Paenibacillus mesophilus]|uniref:tRNA 2-selenouridine(34) synthase MnmH n=1 Tax=Paenibacillus mesophilus TaxID=2582849 RepID=UPI00110E00A1|nr:tRNA 2-selenouridine(34) synthase MnmH [Paenibacillus mesophilus]TMV43587.1 tRNA 2-selenouridine(34) synthase MnmH [Paenibacillus mesophilus]
MLQDLALTDLIDLRGTKELVLIDVRSPSEYKHSSIPGSLNIPLFDDAERAEIGTLYKQVSIQAAKERGLEIVSAKLPAFIRRFAEIPGSKAVFCWRGGMRSKTTATLLSLMGIRAYRLTGGYRAYRKWVVDELDKIASEFPAVPYVINGYTGSGKTEILHCLKQRGHPVLDLESMAGHRGSIFGHIGLEANNQKTFDSLLIDELIQMDGASYFIFEAESKRIGKVALPEPIIQKKEQAHQIWLDVPLEVRIGHILDDYKPWDHIEECILSFLKIKSRIHTPIAAEIEKCLKEGDFRRAVELLLVHYYDPRYDHSVTGYGYAPGTVVSANSIPEAVEIIENMILKQVKEPYRQEKIKVEQP